LTEFSFFTQALPTGFFRCSWQRGLRPKRCLIPPLPHSLFRFRFFRFVPPCGGCPLAGKIRVGHAPPSLRVLFFERIPFDPRNRKRNQFHAFPPFFPLLSRIFVFIVLRFFEYTGVPCVCPRLLCRSNFKAHGRGRDAWAPFFCFFFHRLFPPDPPVGTVRLFLVSTSPPCAMKGSPDMEMYRSALLLNVGVFFSSPFFLIFHVPGPFHFLTTTAYPPFLFPSFPLFRVYLS